MEVFKQDSYAEEDIPIRIKPRWILGEDRLKEIKDAFQRFLMRMTVHTCDFSHELEVVNNKADRICI